MHKRKKRFDKNTLIVPDNSLTSSEECHISSFKSKKKGRERLIELLDHVLDTPGLEDNIAEKLLIALKDNPAEAMRNYYYPLVKMLGKEDKSSGVSATEVVDAIKAMRNTIAGPNEVN